MSHVWSLRPRTLVVRRSYGLQPLALAGLMTALGCFGDPPDVGAAAETEDETTGVGEGSTSRDSTNVLTTTGAADTASTGVGTTTDGVTSCGCFTGRCDAEGRCLRRVFVTAGAYTSNFIDRAGADEVCEDEARLGMDNLDPGVRFAALLVFGDGVDNAVSALSLGAGDARFVLPGPELLTVAQSPGGIVVAPGEAGLMRAIDRDAGGEQVFGSSDACEDGASWVWTGITRSPPAVGETCSGWMSVSSSATANVGEFTETGPRWFSTSSACPCGTEPGEDAGDGTLAHLYCFEVPL